MTRSAILQRMADVAAESTARGRAGQIIRDLISYRGESVDSIAAKGAGKVAPKTIRRIIAGDETVTEAKYLPLDNLLGLPIGTLLRVVEGDADAVRDLPWQPGDVYVREYIVDKMGQTGQSRTTRRTG